MITGPKFKKSKVKILSCQKYSFDFETLTIENEELEQFSYDGKRITSVEPDSFVANEHKMKKQWTIEKIDGEYVSNEDVPIKFAEKKIKWEVEFQVTKYSFFEIYFQLRHNHFKIEYDYFEEFVFIMKIQLTFRFVVVNFQ